MDRVTGYGPTVLIFILTIPFLLLLVGVRSDGFHAGAASIGLLNFVFTDTLFAQALAYLQAPLILAIVLRYHSPSAQKITGDGLVKWPNNPGTWLLVGASLAAVVVAYVTRYLFVADKCTVSNLCRTLSQDVNIDLRHTVAGVSPELQRYCSSLIASAISVLTAIFVGSPAK